VSGDVTTLTVVEPETPPDEAEIVTEPDAMADALPESLIYTIAAFEELQLGEESAFLEPSSYWAIAANCNWVPVNSEGEGGLTVMFVICGETQKSSHPTLAARAIMLANRTGDKRRTFILPPEWRLGVAAPRS
jgi:hypothetical protein